MSFFPLKEKEAGGFSSRLCREFYHLLKKHGKLLGPGNGRQRKEINREAWIKAVEALLQDRTEEQVQAGFDCYSREFGKEYCPEFYSLKTFCEGFVKIESLMTRSERSGSGFFRNDDEKKRAELYIKQERRAGRDITFKHLKRNTAGKSAQLTGICDPREGDYQGLYDPDYYSDGPWNVILPGE